LTLSSEDTFWIIYIFLSYLFCSIPFGKIISRKVADIDITQRGSRNIGATNVAREIGFKWGIFTLVFDVLKGFVPVTLFNLSFPNFGIGGSMIGLASLLGHQFSIYQRFRGGKGVATALGIFLALSPFNALIAVLFFVILVYVSDFISLGSIFSAALMPFLLLLSGESRLTVITSLLVAALICLKHKDNIQRLREGRERRWRKKQIMTDAQEDDPTHRRKKNE
jgi:glycerol-3-phosphate acyltransferase PlsY